ncbi:MAG: YvrJ family protein [Methanophagales archaeon]|nr:YvrJ family protein [Methanophagales archaeon]
MLEPEFTLNMISTIGFPIAVTTYLLYERNAATKELTKAINDLTILIKERLK